LPVYLAIVSLVPQCRQKWDICDFRIPYLKGNKPASAELPAQVAQVE